MPDLRKSTKALQQVVDLARKDPDFFHQLVFEPDAAMAKVPEDRALRAAIYGMNGETALAILLGAAPRGFIPAECNRTCGDASCTSTCGNRSCGNTCESSCGETCNQSCTKTTSIVFFAVEAEARSGVRGSVGGRKRK
jgi:hypothetical protein